MWRKVLLHGLNDSSFFAAEINNFLLALYFFFTFMSMWRAAGQIMFSAGCPTFRQPMPESLEMLSWSLPGLPLTLPLPDISLSLAAAVRLSSSEMMENLWDVCLAWGPMAVWGGRAVTVSFSSWLTTDRWWDWDYLTWPASDHRPVQWCTVYSTVTVYTPALYSQSPMSARHWTNNDNDKQTVHSVQPGEVRPAEEKETLWLSSPVSPGWPGAGWWPLYTQHSLHCPHFWTIYFGFLFMPPLDLPETSVQGLHNDCTTVQLIWSDLWRTGM